MPCCRTGASGQKRLMGNFRHRAVAVLAVPAAALAVLAAGCGGGSAPLTRPPSAPPGTSSAPASPSASSAVPSATAPGAHPRITVTPASGLRSGQKVAVQGTGFSPGETLVVTECADKGTATGPGDCALNNLQSVTSDPSGRVSAELTVTKGPFGANKIVCGPAQRCLVSVTQPTPTPTEQATAPITFG